MAGKAYSERENKKQTRSKKSTKKQEYLEETDINEQEEDWLIEGKKLYVLANKLDLPEEIAKIQPIKPLSEQTFLERTTTALYTQYAFSGLFTLPGKPEKIASKKLEITRQPWDTAVERLHSLPRVIHNTELAKNKGQQFSSALSEELEKLREESDWENIEPQPDMILKIAEASSNPAHRPESWWGNLLIALGITGIGYFQGNDIELGHADDGFVNIELEENIGMLPENQSETYPPPDFLASIQASIISLIGSGVANVANLGQYIITYRGKGITIIVIGGTVTAISSGIYYYGQAALNFIKETLNIETEDTNTPPAEMINNNTQANATTTPDIASTTTSATLAPQTKSMAEGDDDEMQGDQPYKKGNRYKKKIPTELSFTQGEITNEDGGRYFTSQTNWRSVELKDEVDRLLTKTQLPVILTGNSMAPLLSGVFDNISRKNHWKNYGATVRVSFLITVNMVDEILTIAETVLTYPALFGGKQTITELLDLIEKTMRYFGSYQSKKNNMQKRIEKVHQQLQSMPEYFTEEEIKAELSALKKSDKLVIKPFIILVANRINRTLVKAKGEGHPVYRYIVENAQTHIVDNESMVFNNTSKTNNVLSEMMGWSGQNEIILAIVTLLSKYDLNGNLRQAKTTTKAAATTTEVPVTMAATILSAEMAAMVEVMEESAKPVGFGEILEYREFIAEEKTLTPELKENATIILNDIDAIEQFEKIFHINETLLVISVVEEGQEDFIDYSQIVETDFENDSSLTDNKTVKRSVPKNVTMVVNGKAFLSSIYNFLNKTHRTVVPDTGNLNESTFVHLHNIIIDNETKNKIINPVRAYAKLAEYLLEKMDKLRGNPSLQEEYYWYSEHAKQIISFIEDMPSTINKKAVQNITKKLRKRFHKINYKPAIERIIPGSIFKDLTMMDDPRTLVDQMPDMNRGDAKSFMGLANKHSLQNGDVDLVRLYQIYVVYLSSMIKDIMSGAVKVDNKEQLIHLQDILKEASSVLNNKLYFFAPKDITMFFDNNKDLLNQALNADFSHKKDIDFDDVIDKLYLAMAKNKVTGKKELELLNMPKKKLWEEFTKVIEIYINATGKSVANKELDITHHLIDKYINVSIIEPYKNQQTYFDVSQLNRETLFQASKIDGTGQPETVTLGQLLKGEVDLDEYQINFHVYIPKKVMEAIVNTAGFKSFAKNEIEKNYNDEVKSAFTYRFNINVQQMAMYIFSQHYNKRMRQDRVATEAMTAFLNGTIKPKKVQHTISESRHREDGLPTAIFLPYPTDPEKGVLISLIGDNNYYIVCDKLFIKENESYRYAHGEEDPSLSYINTGSFKAKMSQMLEGDPDFQQFMIPHLSPYDVAYGQLFTPELKSYVNTKGEKILNPVFAFEDIPNLTDYLEKEAPITYKRYLLDSIETMETMSERRHDKNLEKWSGILSGMGWAIIVAAVVVATGGAAGVFAAGAVYVAGVGLAAAGAGVLITNTAIEGKMIANAKTRAKSNDQFSSLVFSLVSQVGVAKGVSMTGEVIRAFWGRPAVHQLLRNMIKSFKNKPGTVKKTINEIMGKAKADAKPLIEHIELNKLSGPAVNTLGTIPKISTLKVRLKQGPQNSAAKDIINHLAATEESEVMRVTTWSNQYASSKTRYALRIFDPNTDKFIIYDPFLGGVNKEFAFQEEERWLSLNKQQGTTHTLIKVQYFANMEAAENMPVFSSPFEYEQHTEILSTSDWYSYVQETSFSTVKGSFDESTSLPKGFGIKLSTLNKHIKTISPVAKTSNYNEVFDFSSADAAFRKLQRKIPVKLMMVVNEGESAKWNVGYILTTEIEGEKWIIDLETQSARLFSSWKNTFINKNNLQEKVIFMREYKAGLDRVTNLPNAKFYNLPLFDYREVNILNIPVVERGKLMERFEFINNQIASYEHKIEILNSRLETAETPTDKQTISEQLRHIQDSYEYRSLSKQKDALTALKKELNLLFPEELLYTSEVSEQLKISITPEAKQSGAGQILIDQPDDKGVVTDITGKHYLVLDNNELVPFSYHDDNKLSGVVQGKEVYFTANRWEAMDELFARIDKVIDPELKLSAATLTEENMPKPVSAQSGYRYESIYYRGDLQTSPATIEYFIKIADDFYPVEWSDEFGSWKLTKGKNSKKGDWYVKCNDEEKWGLNRVAEEDRLELDAKERHATSGIRMDRSGYNDVNYSDYLNRRKAQLEYLMREVGEVERDDDYISLEPLEQLVIFPMPERTEVITLADIARYAREDFYNNYRHNPNLYIGLKKSVYPSYMRSAIGKIEQSVYESKHMAKLALKGLNSSAPEDIARVNSYLSGAYGTDDPVLIALIKSELINKFQFIYTTLKEMMANKYRNIVVSSTLDAQGQESFPPVRVKNVLAVSFPDTIDKKIVIPYENNRGDRLFELEDTIGHETSHFIGTEDAFYLGTLHNKLYENAESARIYAQTELINGLSQEDIRGDVMIKGGDDVFFSMMSNAYSSQGKTMSPSHEALNAMPALVKRHYRLLLVQQVLNDPKLLASFLANNADYTAMAMRDIAYGRAYDDAIRRVVIYDRDRRDINATLSDSITNTASHINAEFEAHQMTKLILSFYSNATKLN